MSLPVIGWREWVALPDLGVDKLRCKVDTGARTSALHAFYVEHFEEDGISKVKFGLHPIEKNTEEERHCVAEVLETRVVTDSGGHQEERYVIKTALILGSATWPIEITLTNRDTMSHRMLLGRIAISDNYLVDSGAIHLAGDPSNNPVSLPLVSRSHDEEEE